MPCDVQAFNTLPGSSTKFSNPTLCLMIRSLLLSLRVTSHPERFVHGVPSLQPLPAENCINPPEDRIRTELQVADRTQPNMTWGFYAKFNNTMSQNY